MSTRHHLSADLKGDMDKYLGKLEQSRANSREERVERNKAHAREALTDGVFASSYTEAPQGLTYSMTESSNQILLEQGLEVRDSIEAREKPLAHAKAVAASFDELIEQYDIDVMIAPCDCMPSTNSGASSKWNLDSTALIRRSLIRTYRDPRSQLYR
ncbi:hypothetical protein XPA_009765 [Xanthoria parietina]